MVAGVGEISYGGTPMAVSREVLALRGHSKHKYMPVSCKFVGGEW